MLKRLAMLNIVLCLFIGSNALIAIPLNPQGESHTTHHKDDTSKQNPITQQTVTVNCPNGNEGNEISQLKDAIPAKGQYDYSALGFRVNLLLMIITLVIAAASLIQAFAAKRSAEAVMRSERAWILPDGDKIGLLTLVPVPPDLPENARKTAVYCPIGLRNCGNTPASAIKWEFELRIGESKETPPSFEIYESKPTPSMDGQTPFPIGQDRLAHAEAFLKPYPYISAAEKLEIDAGNKIIWLCGIARYYDVFRHRKFLERKPEEHKTLICLRYEARIDGSSGAWFLGGPSGYNRAT
jgi:hypothetical protein